MRSIANQFALSHLVDVCFSYLLPSLFFIFSGFRQIHPDEFLVEFIGVEKYSKIVDDYYLLEKMLNFNNFNADCFSTLELYQYPNIPMETGNIASNHGQF